MNGIVSYRSLTRPQFSTLQQALFPIYFSIQSALPVVMALTYPGLHTPSKSTPSGVVGLLARENRFSAFVPIATMFALNVTNLLVVGPATTKVMRDRKHQGLSTTHPDGLELFEGVSIFIETKDGKKSYDSPPHSKEMTRLNKSFGRTHSVSASLNLISLLIAVGYGMVLSERIQ